MSKPLVRKAIKSFILLGVFCLFDGSTKAFAADLPDFSYTSNFGILSDYVSRGLNLNWGKPALSGGIESLHNSGVYVSTYFSQISNHFYAVGIIEADLYAGFRHSNNDQFSCDISVGSYFYPGANYCDIAPKGSYKNQRYDTVEAITSVTYRWLNLKYSRCITNYYGYNDQTVPLTSVISIGSSLL